MPGVAQFLLGWMQVDGNLFFGAKDAKLPSDKG
jgi:hypothetical protein